jgi:signal transduction histidine kinase
LPALYARVDANVPRRVVLRRFLVYLTCGEALSFNRALYLHLDTERQALVYQTGMGLGSVAPDRFLTIAEAARDEGIEHILDRAGTLSDDAFDACLRDFAVDATDPDVQALLRDTEPLRFQPVPLGRWPAWAVALGQRIDTKEFLAVAVRAKSEAGVFVVDRRYRQMPLNEASLAALRTFAQVAGHILSNHARVAEMVSKETEAWQRLSFSAAHKLGNPLFAIETNIDTLEAVLAAGDREAVTGLLDDMKVSVAKAKAVVNQFKSLTRARHLSSKLVRLAPLLGASFEVARKRGLSCALDCEPPDLALEADPERLAECFDELVANAMYWLAGRGGTGRIGVEAAPAAAADLPRGLGPERQYARVRFTDNGPGVPANDKPRIFDPFFTTRDAGTGLGLVMVRWVIEGHGGAIVECGTPGAGAAFDIFFPLAVGSAVPAAPSAEERESCRPTSSSSMTSSSPATPSTAT